MEIPTNFRILKQEIERIIDILKRDGVNSKAIARQALINLYMRVGKLEEEILTELDKVIILLNSESLELYQEDEEDGE